MTQEQLERMKTDLRLLLEGRHPELAQQSQRSFARSATDVIHGQSERHDVK
jgi:hypothetical protein